MDWNIVKEIIKPELFILVVMCYCFGLFLKELPRIPDWTIPLILLVFTIIMSIFYLGFVVAQEFNGAVIVNGIVYGILCASLAVYGDQVFKQIIYKRKE